MKTLKEDKEELKTANVQIGDNTSYKTSCSFSIESLLQKAPRKRAILQSHQSSKEKCVFKGQGRRNHIVTAKCEFAELKTESLGSVKVALENKGLWDAFRSVGTEMVITKNGRRMFPPLRFIISGLNSSKRYVVGIEMHSADNFRYKYHDSTWCITGKAFADAPKTNRTNVHPESPSNGAKWTSNIISFHKLKITNNVNGLGKHILLNSLQKYQPRLHITECNDVSDDIFGRHPTITIIFPETAFIAVTAYQSEEMTQLKIDNNPFAKGFRDSNALEIERVCQYNKPPLRYDVVPSHHFPDPWLSANSLLQCNCCMLYSPIQPTFFNNIHRKTCCFRFCDKQAICYKTHYG